MGVRGEQPLPGNPERLLEATNKKNPARTRPWRSYLAVSVTVEADGTTSVRKLTLDPHTARVVTELLDEIEPAYGQALTPGETLRHWAHELVLRDLDQEGVA